MVEFRVWDPETAAAIIADHRSRPGALLPILHGLMEHFGSIDPRAIPLIADALLLSRAEIHGVISFYPDFREQPTGRHHLKLCRAEACQAVGARRLQSHIQHRLGLKPGETDAAGRWTVEAIYCLGNCALGPAVMIDGDLYGRVDPARLDALVAAVAP